MGAYNSTTTGQPNLHVSSTGQILRVDPIKTPSFTKTSVVYDLNPLPAHTSLKVHFGVDNSSPGQTVNVSPSAELPDGLVIAYARVCEAGKVEIKFTNATDQIIDANEMEFYILVFD
jgi:hypothetical protein